MTWRNAFDIGACELQCWKDGVQMTELEMAADGITLTEEDGVVTLDVPWAVLTIGGLYQARVVPSYGTNSAQARLIGMSADTAESNAIGGGGGWSPQENIGEPLYDFNTGLFDPDPYQFAPIQAWSWAGMHLEYFPA